MSNLNRRVFPLVTGLFLLATSLLISPPSVAKNGTPPGKVKDTYLVTLKPEYSAKKYAKTIAKKYGGKAQFVYDEVLGGFSFRGSATKAAKLAADQRVEAVEQDQTVHLLGDAPSEANHLVTVGAEKALDNGYTGQGVKIAMLDTGINKNHDAFEDHDNIDSDDDAHKGCSGGSTNDGNGHGTATASNAAGLVGTAHEATLVAIKVFPGKSTSLSSWSNVICGLNHVKDYNDDHPDEADDIDVVNLSLGGGGSEALRNAINDVVDSGVVVVAAAGNHKGAPDAPAKYEQVIAVSGMNHGGTKMAKFSARGEIAAPAAKIYSAALKDHNFRAKRRNGTSFASPQVAGAAAVLLAVDPTLTPEEVFEALVSGGTCKASGVNDDGGFCDGPNDKWGHDNTNFEPRLDVYCAAALVDPGEPDCTEPSDPI